MIKLLYFKENGILNELKFINFNISYEFQKSRYIFAAPFSGCSAARLAHLVWDQRVAGSNPATPTKEKALSA